MSNGFDGTGAQEAAGVEPAGAGPVVGDGARQEVHPTGARPEPPPEPAPEPPVEADVGAARLAVLKALGDNTRYAIYLEVARSPLPLGTAEIADHLGLHPNTVRPHLERMREVGLLSVEADTRGGVGRPQHLYSLAPGAPSLGLEPPAFPVLARMLLSLARSTGASPEDAVEAGREQGRVDGARRAGRPCLDALVDVLAVLGFDPAVLAVADGATVAFAHCPFRDLAEANPDLVCGLHRGLVEGVVDAVGGGAVAAFHPLVDRTPCQVQLDLPVGPEGPLALGAR
ncbi:MAG: helix-turn-helix domain-containing protein [Actinobacteria bacterium]|nr:helix-turn-helix domain-containing protein [Actinomycetota bacterium]